ncbi:MAG: FeoA domain-containing protein [Eubacteriales bacterium]|nr:FeoA domain-containing protein [Eubacteriales bacterium]
MVVQAILPLGFLTPGRDAVVRDVVGARNLRQRLNEMGFARGTVVRIVQSQPCGPIIISIGDSRVVLGWGAAQKVMVEEVGN